MASDAPNLACPECGVPLLPATMRARHDDDGNLIEHRLGCRCAWCEWMWSDDDDPVRCACGALVGVSVDDDAAYATTIEDGPAAPLDLLADINGMTPEGQGVGLVELLRAGKLPCKYAEGEWRLSSEAEAAAIVTYTSVLSPETGDVGWCWRWRALDKMGDAPSYDEAKRRAEEVVMREIERVER